MFLRVLFLLSSLAPASIVTAQAVSTPSVDVAALKLPLSIMLSGKATWVGGGKEDSGNVTLTASLDGSASEKWDLSSTGTLKWAQTALAANRSCQSVSADGQTLDTSGTNCLRAVAWFAPWYAPAVVASKLATSLDLTEAAKLQGTQRVRYSILLDPPKNPKSSAAAALKRLVDNSAVEIDTTTDTSLPASLHFQEIAGDSSGAHLDVTVSFSDYRLEGGFMVPHRIKRYLQHSLQADIQITSVTLQ